MPVDELSSLGVLVCWLSFSVSHQRPDDRGQPIIVFFNGI